MTTTGTFLTRGKAKIAQRERYKQFNSKTQASSARDTWKKASGQARKLRGKAAELRQQGNALMSGGRRDGAVVNVSLSSRARSSSINAGLRGLEMTRRADRLESRARSADARAKQAGRPSVPRKRQPAASLAARIAAGEVTLKNAQAKRGEQRLMTLWSRRMNSSPSKRLKAEETKRRAQGFYNTKGRTWRERKPVTRQQAAKPARQPLTIEQRKAKLLQVHGRAMEADLSKRKGLTRYQVRDILDAGSTATVVRNIKKWVGRNRGSMTAPSKSAAKPKAQRGKPAPLRPDYVEVVAANKRKLQSLNRQIRQGGPGALQLRAERRMLQVKISGLESQGRRR